MCVQAGLENRMGEAMHAPLPSPRTTTARLRGPSRSRLCAAQFWTYLFCTYQFWNGVFSAKYSWLSALSTALVGLVFARFFAAVWP